MALDLLLYQRTYKFQYQRTYKFQFERTYDVDVEFNTGKTSKSTARNKGNY